MALTLTKRRNDVPAESSELTVREIVRAWEDKDFRARLSPRQLMQLPGHPAGVGRLMSVLEGEQNNSASSDNCSSSNCSSSNCSSENCSGNMCSNWDCGGGSGN